MQRLKLDFRADPNPVFVWQAIALAGELRSELPAWVTDYLNAAAQQIIAIFDRVMAGQRAGREPDQVGKALGFGQLGAGRVGYFERAKLQERDRRVYLEVQAEIDNGREPTKAYRIAANYFEMKEFEVKEIYERIRKVTGERQKTA